MFCFVFCLLLVCSSIFVDTGRRMDGPMVMTQIMIINHPVWIQSFRIIGMHHILTAVHPTIIGNIEKKKRKSYLYLLFHYTFTVSVFLCNLLTHNLVVGNGVM